MRLPLVLRELFLFVSSTRCCGNETKKIETTTNQMPTGRHYCYYYYIITLEYNINESLYHHHRRRRRELRLPVAGFRLSGISEHGDLGLYLIRNFEPK